MREKERAERDKTLLEKARAAKESVVQATKAAKEAIQDPAGLVAGTINERMGTSVTTPSAGGKAQAALFGAPRGTLEKAVEKTYDKRGGNEVAKSAGRTSTLASIQVMEHAAAEFDRAASAAPSGGRSSTPDSAWAYGTASADKATTSSGDKAAQAFSTAAADAGARRPDRGEEESKRLEYERTLSEKRVSSAPLLKAHEEKMREIRAAQAELSLAEAMRGSSSSSGRTSRPASTSSGSKAGCEACPSR